MNIYDVAREAGVSISTVSRVLNHRETVSAATRAKVEAVLARHDYAPSAIARGMMGKPMRMVAVLTVDLRDPHYARTVYTIEREFSRRGYEVTICNTGDSVDETAKYLRSMRDKQADGFVLVGSVFDRLGRDGAVEPLLRRVPVVLANGALPLPGAYSVLVDDRYGIGLAVDHLVAQGHRDIVYLKVLDTDSARAKRAGFVQAMARHGLPCTDAHVLEVEKTLDGGLAAAKTLLEGALPFTAVVCGEDVAAAGALKGFLRAGLRVPQDVAVIGYNNSEYARTCEPQLTTVDNKPETVGMLCVQLLAGRIEGTGEYPSLTIQPELVHGGTG